MAGRTGFIEVDSGAFEVPGTQIRVSISDLFAELDENPGLWANFILPTWDAIRKSVAGRPGCFSSRHIF
jgi:hypothetical protein